MSPEAAAVMLAAAHHCLLVWTCCSHRTAAYQSAAVSQVPLLLGPVELAQVLSAPLQGMGFG